MGGLGASRTLPGTGRSLERMSREAPRAHCSSGTRRNAWNIRTERAHGAHAPAIGTNFSNSHGTSFWNSQTVWGIRADIAWATQRARCGHTRGARGRPSENAARAAHPGATKWMTLWQFLSLSTDKVCSKLVPMFSKASMGNSRPLHSVATETCLASVGGEHRCRTAPSLAVVFVLAADDEELLCGLSADCRTVPRVCCGRRGRGGGLLGFVGCGRGGLCRRSPLCRCFGCGSSVLRKSSPKPNMSIWEMWGKWRGRIAR